MRASVRKLLLAGIGLLYLISVPWYRQTGGEVDVLLGLPSWVTVALACYVAVALLNCAAWLLVDMPDEDDPRDGADSDAHEERG
jgi:hypothetical protein